jgi:predicted Fe-Mo cluster-binding NifX family protein
MRFAIPLSDGRLCAHFGHCERFALIDADTTSQTIVRQEEIESPEHQPGLLPAWLSDRGANIVIAGGMGPRAQELFTKLGIELVIGAPSDDPETIVRAYLAGTLQLGENACDH